MPPPPGLPPSTMDMLPSSRLLDRFFFLLFSFLPSSLVDWSSSGMGGGGGDEGIIICLGRFRWESPDAEDRKLLIVLLV